MKRCILLAAAMLATSYATALGQFQSRGGNATTVNGASVPASQTCLGSNSSGQITPGTCSSAASGSVTTTVGTGVTSVTCVTATCTTERGTYTIVGGTATTGTIATLTWPTTTTAWACSTSQDGGSTYLGVGHSVATATGMNITAAVAVTGLTVTFDYTCKP